MLKLHLFIGLFQTSKVGHLITSYYILIRLYYSLFELAQDHQTTQCKFAHSGDCGGGRREVDTTSSGLRRIFVHKGENVGKGDRGIRMAKTYHHVNIWDI